MNRSKIKTLVFLLSLFISLEISAQDIALQLYSLREQMKTDVKGTHLLLPKWGIKYVEGGSTYGMSLKEYKDFLDKHGLAVISVGADYQQLKDKPQEVVDLAKSFGAKYATCFWIPHPPENFSIKEAREAVEVFNNAGKILKEEGIHLAYHPHGYEFQGYEEGVLFDYIIENAENFDFNMDVYWVKMGGGDPLALMKKFPEKFPMLHLKDRRIGTQGNAYGRGDVETNVVLGSGDIDIKAIILQAKKNGTAYLIIEDESSRSVEQIPQSIAYIKKVLSEK